jgi:hypothetical protein
MELIKVMGTSLWPEDGIAWPDCVESTDFSWLSFSTTAFGSKKISQMTMALAATKMIRVFNI